MKRLNFILIVTLLILTTTVYGQKQLTVKAHGDATLEKILPQDMLFYFENFQDAVIVREGDQETKTKINMNLFTQKVLFLTSGNQALELARPFEVERIVVGDAVWKPVDDTFAPEVFSDGEHSLFLVKQTNLTDVRREGGFGISSSVAATTALTTHSSEGRGAEDIMPAGDYDFETKEQYRIVIGDKSYNADTRGFRSAFSGNNRAIRNYIRSNSIDFEKEEDVVNLLKFCIEL